MARNICPVGFLKLAIRIFFEIKTSRGFSFRATDNHKVLVVDYKSREDSKKCLERNW